MDEDQTKQFNITAAERQSALWVKLMKHWREELDIAHRKNEKNLDVVATANMRGRIALLNQHLKLNEDIEIPEEEDNPFAA